jgi:hypothetical protein
VLVQLRLETELSSEDYIRQEAWRNARIPACPVHPKGGCGLRKVGYYTRVEPPGLRVPYWHCPKAHQCFSLLPDFAASHVSSTLCEIEQVVERFDAHCDGGLTAEAAAVAVGPRVSRESAVRWVARRRRWVRAALAIAIGLLPAVLAGCEPTLASVREALGKSTPVVLVRVRELATGKVSQMPAPVGFAHPRRVRKMHVGRGPERTGPDPPA